MTVQQLEKDWRDRAARLTAEEQLRTGTIHPSELYYLRGQRWSLLQCADELAALLNEGDDTPGDVLQ